MPGVHRTVQLGKPRTVTLSLGSQDFRMDCLRSLFPPPNAQNPQINKIPPTSNWAYGTLSIWAISLHGVPEHKKKLQIFRYFISLSIPVQTVF